MELEFHENFNIETYFISRLSMIKDYIKYFLDLYCDLHNINKNIVVTVNYNEDDEFIAFYVMSVKNGIISEEICKIKIESVPFKDDPFYIPDIKIKNIDIVHTSTENCKNVNFKETMIKTFDCEPQPSCIIINGDNIKATDLLTSLKNKHTYYLTTECDGYEGIISLIMLNITVDGKEVKIYD